MRPRRPTYTLTWFVLRELVVYNPLFLLSATLVLVGTWLLNPPTTTGGRPLVPLLELGGTLLAYELVVLGAAALLSRRARLERDVRNLAVILFVFLSDMTLTKSTLLVTVQTESGVGAWCVGLGLLGVSLRHMGVVRRLLGSPLSSRGWACLYAGPVFATVFPLVAHGLALWGAPSEGIPLLGGAAVGAALLAFGGVAREHVALPWLALVTSVLCGVHLFGQTWAHGGSAEVGLGLVSIAAGVAVPKIVWPERAVGDGVTPLVGAVAGVWLCAGAPEAVAGWTSWQVGLLGVAGVHGVLAVRRRAWGSWLVAPLALDLALGGATPSVSWQSLGQTPVEPVVLFGLYGLGVARGYSLVGMQVPLVLAAITTALHVEGALRAVVAADVMGLGMFVAAWLDRTQEDGGARLRLLGGVLVSVPAYGVWALGGAAVGVWAVAGLGGCAVWAVARRDRMVAAPLPLVLVEGGIAAAPSSAVGWGVAGIGAGFVVVSLGVVLSVYRERILAWIEETQGEGGLGSDAERVPHRMLP